MAVDRVWRVGGYKEDGNLNTKISVSLPQSKDPRYPRQCVSACIIQV